MKIVEVTWLDARHEFEPECDAKQAKLATMQTVGYLLRYDKELVVVAMEQFEGNWRNRTTIPRSAVKRTRTIEK